MQVVLVVLVVASCAVNYTMTRENARVHRDLALHLVDWSSHWQREMVKLEETRLQNDARATELQAALSQAELQARTRERVAAMQQAVVPPEGTGPVDAWFSGGPQVQLDDPDPMNVDPLPEQQFPTFGEQQDGGFAVPAGQQYGVMVPPGTSLIPGSDNEAQVEDVH